MEVKVNTSMKEVEGSADGVPSFSGNYGYDGREVWIESLDVYELDGSDLTIGNEKLADLKRDLRERLDEDFGTELLAQYEYEQENPQWRDDELSYI